MLLRRSLANILEDSIRELFLARGHYLVAKNAYNIHRKTRGVNPLTLVSALSGYPITYSTFGSLSMTAGDKRVKKTLLRINKATAKIKREKPWIYHRIGNRLESITTSLNRVLTLDNIDEKIAFLENIIAELKNLCNEVRVLEIGRRS
ncbi:MAG: hypothetical protein ABWW65_00015 [Thermoprotei archaeon]